MDQTRQYAIGPYRRGDREAVRGICVACCWMGDYRPERIPDEWIWAEYWTRYFTDRQPRYTWVVRRPDDGEVVGYLTGTDDERRFDRYVPYLFGGIVWRVIRKRLLRKSGPRAAMAAMGRSLLRGELDLPKGIAERYPATFHFNLLPEARGARIGSEMVAAFIARMRAARVRGIHLQVLGANPVVPGFLARRGFEKVESRPLGAFSHVDGRAVDVQTWVRGL